MCLCLLQVTSHSGLRDPHIWTVCPEDIHDVPTARGDYMFALQVRPYSNESEKVSMVGLGTSAQRLHVALSGVSYATRPSGWTPRASSLNLR